MAKGELESAVTPTDSSPTTPSETANERREYSVECTRTDYCIEKERLGRPKATMRLDSHLPPGHQVIIVTFARLERLRKPLHIVLFSVHSALTSAVMCELRR